MRTVPDVHRPARLRRTTIAPMQTGLICKTIFGRPCSGCRMHRGLRAKPQAPLTVFAPTRVMDDPSAPGPVAKRSGAEARRASSSVCVRGGLSSPSCDAGAHASVYQDQRMRHDVDAFSRGRLDDAAPVVAGAAEGASDHASVFALSDPSHGVSGSQPVRRCRAVGAHDALLAVESREP